MVTLRRKLICIVWWKKNQRGILIKPLGNLPGTRYTEITSSSSSGMSCASSAFPFISRTNFERCPLFAEFIGWHSNGHGSRMLPFYCRRSRRSMLVSTIWIMSFPFRQVARYMCSWFVNTIQIRNTICMRCAYNRMAARPHTIHAIIICISCMHAIYDLYHISAFRISSKTCF